MLAGSRSSPATLLPVGLAAARNFGSFEELATWAPAWNESEIQLGRGRFRGRLVVAHTARIQLALVVRRPGVLCRGTPPPGTRVVGLCLSAGPAFVQGRPFRRGDVPVIRGGMPYEFRAPGAHLVFLLAVEELLLSRHAASRARPQAFDVDGWMRLRDGEAGRALGRAWYGELRRALRDPGALVDPVTSSRVEDAVLDALLDATTELPSAGRPATRTDPLRRAEEYLTAHLAEPVTVSELSRAVGVPVRTLHSGFRRSLGLPPKTYGRVLRLNAARVDLRKAGPGVTVSQVAIRWGFFHLGNFAADYRRMFGESPSETLRPA
jgi:AraC family transcriptional regulator, ethanolamine operon transcriptional activator